MRNTGGESKHGFTRIPPVFLFPFPAIMICKTMLPVREGGWGDGSIDLLAKKRGAFVRHLYGRNRKLIFLPCLRCQVLLHSLDRNGVDAPQRVWSARRPRWQSGRSLRGFCRAAARSRTRLQGVAGAGWCPRLPGGAARGGSSRLRRSPAARLFAQLQGEDLRAHSSSIAAILPGLLLPVSVRASSRLGNESHGGSIRR